MKKKMRACQAVVTVVAILGACAGDATAQVLRVDKSNAASGDGSSWGQAFVELGEALDAASLDLTVEEIWVAAGTYAPGGPGARASTFSLKDGLQILGGFQGNEASAIQRDPDLHITVLSGDLDGNDTFGAPQWDGVGWGGYDGNSYHVVSGSGVGPSAVLDGFEIIGGSSASGGIPVPFGDFGGGLFLQSSSPTIRNCHFRRNIAGDASGAAVFSQNGSPTIESCRFTENRVFQGQGAGLYFGGSGTPVVRDSEFISNVSIGGSSLGGGAGIFASSGSPCLIERCVFSLNVAKNFHLFGDPFGSFGGGLYNLADGMVVRDCAFRGNRAHAGGGIYNWGNSVEIANCLFADNFVASYEIDSASAAGGGGGGVAAQALAVATTSILGCTFATNTAGEGGGAMTYGQASFFVRNSICFDNMATGQEVSLRQAQIKGNLDVAYCCIEGLFQPQQPGDPAPTPAQFPGSIETSPGFADVACGDLRLSTGSPCLDAGDNSAVPAGMTTDLSGGPRFIDDPAVVDSGSGLAPLVDFGAYEGSVIPPSAPLFVRGDANRSGSVNLADAINILTYLFSGGSAECLSALDTNDNGSLSIGDAVFLLSYMFQGAVSLGAPFPACGIDPTPDLLGCDTCVPCL